MKIMEEIKKFLFVLFVEKQILVCKQISMSQPNITNYIMIFIETRKQMIGSLGRKCRKDNLPLDLFYSRPNI